jgi:hypothetical protein
MQDINIKHGRAVTQGVNLRVPGFEPASNYLGSFVIRAAVRKVFSEEFGFLCHSFVPLTALQPSPSIAQIWYNRTINGRINSGLGFTPAPFYLFKSWVPRTLLQLKLVGILTINLFIN